MTTNRQVKTVIVPDDWWKALPRKVYAELQRLESNQPWFEVYKIDPEIYVFYESGQFEEVISYLVIGKNRAALIDTGCGIGNVKTLAKQFTQLPIIVVNTHSHYDHIAQNYLFDEVALFDSPFARRAARKGCRKTQMARLLAEGMVWKHLPDDFDRENYHVPRFNVTWWLNDGDLIDLGERKLEIIHTPGHSPDSICLLDRDARLFWTGDTFYTGAIYTHLPGSDFGTFIRSYEKMISLSAYFDKLMPSHNEPWVEKTMLLEVLEAVRNINLGTAEYVEEIEDGTKIRRYEFHRFALITKA